VQLVKVGNCETSFKLLTTAFSLPVGRENRVLHVLVSSFGQRPLLQQQPRHRESQEFGHLGARSAAALEYSQKSLRVAERRKSQLADWKSSAICKIERTHMNLKVCIPGPGSSVCESQGPGQFQSGRFVVRRHWKAASVLATGVDQTHWSFRSDTRINFNFSDL